VPQLDLAGITLKLDRANEHLNRLRSESKARERKNPYGFRTKDKRRSAKKVEVTVYAEVRSSPPPEWGPIIGDVVQNIRAALDYAVWDLSRSSKRSNQTAFPIYKDGCEYQVLSPAKISGVPKAHQTVIQEAQPYQWVDGPEFHALADLQLLSNKDKHRTLIPTAVIHDIGFVSTTNAETEFTFTLAGGDEIEDGAPVFGFIAWPHDPSLEMHVQPGVSFDEGIEGRPLISTLESIFHYASYVISRLASIS
jgi:hypothetical protein